MTAHTATRGSRHPEPPRRISPRSLAPALAMAAAALSGCGVSAQHPPAERGVDVTRQEVSGPVLSRPANTVLAEGAPLDVLAPLAAKPFAVRSTGAVHYTRTSSAQAFTNLCDGKVDVIEPGEAITHAQTAACSGHHLELLGPLTVGWDAIVLAVKNEADVGGDCLTTQQADDVFRAGSPYTNWSQLSFYDIPLSAVGSLSEPVPAELFARSVLGQTSLSSADLRSDFVATPNVEVARRQIVGAGRASQVQAAVRRRLAQLRAQTQAERERLVEAAERRADASVLAQIAATNERNRRLKITVDAQALDRHNVQIDAAAKRSAALAANAQLDAQLAERAAQPTAPLAARANTPGVVGFVRFSYYEQWEEQLRPFEIWSTKASSASPTAAQSPNCVFPSAQTVSSGHYPFAFQLRLYTTRQALDRRVVREYLLYLLTNAQTLAANVGLVPITDAQRDSDLLALGVQPPANTTMEPSATAGTSSSAGSSSAAGTASATGSAASPASQTPVRPGVPGVGASVPQTSQVGSP